MISIGRKLLSLTLFDYHFNVVYDLLNGFRSYPRKESLNLFWCQQIKIILAINFTFSYYSCFLSKNIVWGKSFQEIKSNIWSGTRSMEVEKILKHAAYFFFQTASIYPFLHSCIECVLMLRSYLWQWQGNVIFALFSFRIPFSKIYFVAKYWMRVLLA